MESTIAHNEVTIIVAPDTPEYLLLHADVNDRLLSTSEKYMKWEEEKKVRIEQNIL